MKELIFTKGGLATLDYFVDRLCLAADEAGVPYTLLDIRQPAEQQEVWQVIASGADCAVIMFNNVGLSLPNHGMRFWEQHHLPIYNIFVDHPRAFHLVLDQPPSGFHACCIDRNHVKYINRFHPAVKTFFLPHGGFEKNGTRTLAERQIDVLYVGSVHKQPPLYHIDILSDRGESFYQYVIPALQDSDDLTCEDAIRDYLAAVGLGSELAVEKKLNEDYGANCEHYVRRKRMIYMLHALDEAGICVEVYGQNWEDPDRAYSENIRIHGLISPEQCIEKMSHAKISLNMMPWFRDGTHERIYNGMLNGALCLTDESVYLRETLSDRENIVFYPRKHPEELAGIIEFYLSHPDEAQRIMESGRQHAITHNSWANRLMQLRKMAGDG